MKILERLKTLRLSQQQVRVPRKSKRDIRHQEATDARVPNAAPGIKDVSLTQGLSSPKARATSQPKVRARLWPTCQAMF